MKYIAFFRGINVGGNNKVKMADLKKLFQDCGFGNVKTYIQSGNVLFESEKDRRLLPDIISHAFTERFHFQSHMILRSDDEISEIISALPFTKEEITQAEAKMPDVEHVYIFLSKENVNFFAVKAVLSSYDGNDKLCAGKHALYLLCDHSIRDSKLAASLVKLDATLTSRNQKTMLKIDELLRADTIN